MSNYNANHDFYCFVFLLLVFLGTLVRLPNSAPNHPIFVGHYKGLSHKYKWGVFIFKIGHRYYAALQERLTANSVQLYCSRKARPEKCKFRIHLKMISVFDPVLPGFYDTNNFVITKYNVSCTHICEGFSSEHEAKRSLYVNPGAKFVYAKRFDFFN